LRIESVRTEIICRYLPLLPDGHSASMTSLLVMLDRGYPTVYHSVELAARIGTSKVTLRAGFANLLVVMRTIMMFAPMRNLLPIALALFSVGAVYSTAVAVMFGEGFPTFGIFLVLTGLMTGMPRLIADQPSRMGLPQYQTIAPYCAVPLARDREATIPRALS
jgi:hypothetical protein